MSNEVRWLELYGTNLAVGVRYAPKTASIPQLDALEQLAHAQADRIAELERQIEAMKAEQPTRGTT